MQWSEFVGNDAAKALVSSFVDQRRLPHALLIEGVPGSGRRTLARQIAQAAVCTNEGERPCLTCAGCRKAASGKHPDIQEWGKDGAARSFHIDSIRTIRDNAYVLPNEAPRRVFLLAEAQNMTDRAQNALLKVLEEPPAHALFILTCESRSQLLPTIRSRTVCLSLGAVSEEEGLPLLKTRFPDKTEDELKKALAVYGGILGQTIEGLSGGAFYQLQTLISQIAAAITAPHELTLLKLTAPFIKDETLADAVLSGLSLLVRDALILQRLPRAASLSADRDTALTLSRTLTAPRLMALASTIEQLSAMRLRNMNPTLFATLMCARLRKAAGR